MTRPEFLNLWNEHFRHVRKRQYAGDPHGPACAAASAWDDEKAGVKTWRKYRKHLLTVAPEQYAKELADSRALAARHAPEVIQ